jgi:hypothetical protein
MPDRGGEVRVLALLASVLLEHRQKPFDTEFTENTEYADKLYVPLVTIGAPRATADIAFGTAVPK